MPQTHRKFNDAAARKFSNPNPPRNWDKIDEEMDDQVKAMSRLKRHGIGTYIPSRRQTKQRNDQGRTEANASLRSGKAFQVDHAAAVARVTVVSPVRMNLTQR